jgi:hypothetical protein
MNSYKHLPLLTLQKLILYEVMTTENTASVRLDAIMPSNDRCTDKETNITYEHFMALVTVRDRQVTYAFQWSTATQSIISVIREHEEPTNQQDQQD